jgi:hypothetical protein
MIEYEDCECPICEYLRKLPVPRNRNERREQEKMIMKDLKVRHEVHMIWTPFDAVMEDEDDEEFNEIEEETEVK